MGETRAPPRRAIAADNGADAPENKSKKRPGKGSSSGDGADRPAKGVACRGIREPRRAAGPESGAGSAQPRVVPCPREPEHTGGWGDPCEGERREGQPTRKNAARVGAETENDPTIQKRASCLER